MLFPGVSEGEEGVKGSLEEVNGEVELEGKSQVADGAPAEGEELSSEDSKEAGESKEDVPVESGDEGDSAVSARSDSDEDESGSDSENDNAHSNENDNAHSNENDNANSNSNDNAKEETNPQPLKEDRDPRLSKYSRRFTFSRHKFSLDDAEDTSKTNYPADHMREGNLWGIRKTLIEREKNALETWRPSLAGQLKHYEELSTYLSFHENIAKYLSQDEMDKFNSLRGQARVSYRKNLNTIIQVKSRSDTKRREKKRKQLFNQMKLVDKGPVCDGCPAETHHAFKPSAKRDTVIRKFVGNEEQFTIYNSTHCPLA